MSEDLVEYDYELDAYYSNVSAFIDLDTANEITDASELSEAELYTRLVLNTLNPNIFLLEAAVHPMPIVGIYSRKNYEESYNSSTINDLNLVRAVTAGFAEPYSLSLFFGRMMVFKNKKSDERVGKNRAYIGYLLTIGDNSIKENVAHANRFMTFEFKLKGTREQKDRDLDWSFRVGAKMNENRNFVDTFYIGARRSSIDYKKSAFSFLYNSAFTALVEVSSNTFKFTNSEFVIEKKFPLSWSEKMSFGLGLGYLYTSNEKYNGILRDEGVENHQLIFRPNLKF
ncbi:hypothetical protein GJV85_03185 [Sulfurimonas aquatica]|uniref:Uncharacterized protein n=1 Tax=Sulfurimonas aquatica TaxID=2672570 RepID=A0A975AZ42_9BACT|nr:hypothetical protein [Sulfurimonas aquatica]QSZ41155.1 hypothetical protein GJV85_03185 [Sulfurimonas aquatica]